MYLCDKNRDPFIPEKYNPFNIFIVLTPTILQERWLKTLQNFPVRGNCNDFPQRSCFPFLSYFFFFFGGGGRGELKSLVSNLVTMAINPWEILEFFWYVKCTWKYHFFSYLFLNCSWMLSFQQNLVRTDSGKSRTSCHFRMLKLKIFFILLLWQEIQNSRVRKSS